MNPTTSRISKTFAAMCVAASIVAPAANAADLRSPDGTDGAVTVAPPQDLRSPDAQDAGVNSQSGSYTQAPGRSVDLRSPDAQDSGISQPTGSYTSAPSSDGSGGSSWDTVGIVGGSVLAVALMGFGLVALNRRRHGIQKSRMPAISS